MVYLSFIGIFCTCLLHLYPPYLHILKRKVERYLHSQYGHVGVMSSIFIAVVNNIVSKLSFDGEVDTWTWRRTAMGRLTWKFRSPLPEPRRQFLSIRRWTYVPDFQFVAVLDGEWHVLELLMAYTSSRIHSIKNIPHTDSLRDSIASPLPEQQELDRSLNTPIFCKNSQIIGFKKRC